MPRYSAAVLAALPLAGAQWEAMAARAVSSALSADPVVIAEQAFGHDHWDVSRAILRSVFGPHARTAVKACHASSKTFTAADCIAIALRLGADVLTTAPTWEQVKTVLWGAVRRTVAETRALGWGSVNQTEITMPDGSHAVGLSTNEGVRFQGWHARPGSFLLVVFDEAPGVRPDIYEAVEGISAGGDVRHLVLGNPIIASGPFYDIFARDAPGWARFTIDAFDTPNLRGLTLEQLLEMGPDELDANVRPYLVTRRWVVDRYHAWGTEHPLWASRVRGQFPLQAADALFSLHWLEEAGRRSATYEPTAGPVVGGLDVAGPGENESVLVVRQGHRILEVSAWSGPDPRGAVLAALRPWRHRGLGSVNVDSAGIGHYFARHLADAGITVSDVNVGESPTSDQAKERYASLKAELYWQLREQFADGEVSGLTDQTMLAQLAGLRYQHDPRGRIVIESKADAVKRGVTSPDRAEALMLAFSPDPPSVLRAQLYGLTGTLTSRDRWRR